MRYIKNNRDDKYKELLLKCANCGEEWSPFGRSGITMCSNCGRDWTKGGFKRVK